MTEAKLKALIEDLRLNHEYCPKDVILQAADELEKALAQPVNPAPFYPLSGDFLAWVAKGEMLLAADGWGPIFHFGVWWGERPWRVWNEMERLKGRTKERRNG